MQLVFYWKSYINGAAAIHLDQPIQREMSGLVSHMPGMSQAFFHAGIFCQIFLMVL